MRVLYIVNSTTTTGGATKSFLTLLYTLRTKGIEPIVLLPDKNGLTKLLQEKCIPVWIHPYNMDIYPPKGGLYWTLMFLPLLLIRRIRHYRALRFLKKQCENHAFDLIHSNTSVVSLGYELAQYLHIPHIYHIREYADLDFGMNYFPSWDAFHRTLHCPNSYSICITRDIQRHHGLSKSPNSFVIYNGVVQDNLKTTHGGREEFYLYAGRIEKAKGVYEMIEAYLVYRANSRHPIPLILAGNVYDMAYWEKIQKMLVQEKAQTDVKWIGEQQDIASYMQRAMATIISSPSEGFGRVMPEAMYNKCIVIAKNTAGTKEQLDNGLQLMGKEIAYRYNTQNELINLLQDLEASDNPKLEIMRESAYQTVCQLYTNTAYTNSIFKLYQTITQ